MFPKRSLVPSVFRTKTLCTFLFSPTHATRLTHHILLDLITLKIFDEGEKLQKSLLYVFHLFLFLLKSTYVDDNFYFDAVKVSVFKINV